jgi:hypothetical protein
VRGDSEKAAFRNEFSKAMQKTEDILRAGMEAENEYVSFGKSVGLRLMKMSPEQAARAQMRIDTVLYEVEFGMPVGAGGFGGGASSGGNFGGGAPSGGYGDSAPSGGGYGDSATSGGGCGGGAYSDGRFGSSDSGSGLHYQQL